MALKFHLVIVTFVISQVLMPEELEIPYFTLHFPYFCCGVKYFLFTFQGTKLCVFFSHISA